MKLQSRDCKTEGAHRTPPRWILNDWICTAVVVMTTTIETSPKSAFNSPDDRRLWFATYYSHRRHVLLPARCSTLTDWRTFLRCPSRSLKISSCSWYSASVSLWRHTQGFDLNSVSCGTIKQPDVQKWLILLYKQQIKMYNECFSRSLSGLGLYCSWNVTSEMGTFDF